MRDIKHLKPRSGHPSTQHTTTFHIVHSLSNYLALPHTPTQAANDEQQSSNSITFQIFAFCDTNFHHNAAQWLPLECHLKASSGRARMEGYWRGRGRRGSGCGWGRNDKERTDRKQHSKQLPLMSCLFFRANNDNETTSPSSGTTMTLTFAAYCIRPAALPPCRPTLPLRPLSKQLQNKGHGLPGPAARSTLSVERWAHKKDQNKPISKQKLQQKLPRPPATDTNIGGRGRFQCTQVAKGQIGSYLIYEWLQSWRNDMQGLFKLEFYHRRCILFW